MRESLVGSVENKDEMAGGLKTRLVINKRWHWRLYIDVSAFLCGGSRFMETNRLYHRFFYSLNPSLTPFPASLSQPTSHSLALSSQN
jgi:hypothetical protein